MVASPIGRMIFPFWGGLGSRLSLGAKIASERFLTPAKVIVTAFPQRGSDPFDKVPANCLLKNVEKGDRHPD